MRRLRYAARSLGRSPLFAAVAVLSLALALAVNTTIFALVDAVIHPYVPYHEARPVFAATFFGGDRSSHAPFDERMRAVREGLPAADAIASYVFLRTSIESGAFVEDGRAAAVSSNMFGLLGVRPVAGRGFGEADDRGDMPPGAVISYALWTRLYRQQGLERNLRIRVGESTYPIVGIMPRGMHFPYATDVWLPLTTVPDDSSAWRFGPIPLFRLRPGATREVALAQLQAIADRLTAIYSPRHPYYPKLLALREPAWWRLSNVQRYMLLAVATVLLIACANLGTMLLARGMARRRELAVRIALGASRRDIISEVLTECGVLVTAGVALGLLLTLWALYLLPHYAVPYVPEIGDLQPVPSWRVFLFAVGVSVLTVLLAGALPAMRAASTDPAEPMKEGAGTTTGAVHDRYNPLIIIEVALSTALLMTAALFIIGVFRLSAFDFHYAGKRVLVADFEMKQKYLGDDAAVERFYDDLIARAAMIPGARSAATVSGAAPDHRMVISEEGRSGERWMNLSTYSIVSPGYLSTLGIPIVQGRDFAPGDQDAATGVVVVDEEAVRRLWPDVPSPVGRMIKLGESKSDRPWLRVVGVARSVELQPHRDIDLPPEPSIYVVYGHDPTRGRTLLVRGERADAAGRALLAVEIRREIERVVPWAGRPGVHPFLQDYDQRRATSAFLASLFTAFGGFGLVLCGVGLYGVLAYAVSRRVRELAMRVALGAQPGDLVRTVVHDAAVTMLAGIGVGAFIALAVTRELADSLFSVHYELVLALVAAEAVLLGVAILACLGPIRQALGANPADILRAS